MKYVKTRRMLAFVSVSDNISFANVVLISYLTYLTIKIGM